MRKLPAYADAPARGNVHKSEAPFEKNMSQALLFDDIMNPDL
jgi:hypothetical protein